MVVQISAVQTDLQRAIEERSERLTLIHVLLYFNFSSLFGCRDNKLRSAVVHRLDEVEQQLKLESKQRVDNEKDAREVVELATKKMMAYNDEGLDSLRQILTVIFNFLFCGK